MNHDAKHDQHLAEAQERMDAVLRAKSPQERLAMVDAMWRSAREIIVAGLRADHPDWTDEEIQRAASKRLSHGAV